MDISIETTVQLILVSSAFFLIWFIFRLRTKDNFHDSELTYEYDGKARNPSLLMDPDELALKELDRLIEDAFEE